MLSRIVIGEGLSWSRDDKNTTSNISSSRGGDSSAVLKPISYKGETRERENDLFADETSAQRENEGCVPSGVRGVGVTALSSNFIYYMRKFHEQRKLTVLGSKSSAASSEKVFRSLAGGS